MVSEELHIPNLRFETNSLNYANLSIERNSYFRNSEAMKVAAKVAVDLFSKVYG